MKLVQASLSARKIEEAVFTTGEVLCSRKRPKSSFLYCGGLLKLVPACLSGMKDQESRFHHFGGPAKLVQVCLSCRKDQKRKFHPCEGPAKLVPACLSGRKELHDLHRTSTVEKTALSIIPTS